IYTLDGTEPTASHGSTYTGAIPIKADAVVKAIGLKGSNIVNRATLNYKITNYVNLKNLTPVDINENKNSMDFYFKPDKTGLYRFFTM
ncbi:hypothetical protein COA10_31555, partial [Bacillus cereus]